MADQFDTITSRLAVAAEFLRKQREYQKRLNLALEITGVGMWDWEMESNTLTWDARMCALFDVAVDTEKTYETFIDRVTPEYRKSVQGAIDKALTGESYEIRYKIQIGDGSQRCIHAKGLVHKNGGPAKMIGVCMEVKDVGCCSPPGDGLNRHHG